MASSDPEASAFFPSLSSLLSGTKCLISLQAAQNAFSVAPKFVADNEALEKFCYDAPTFSLLASCPDTLPKPSTKSKADFEARTAPIQVSGSQNGEYDLEQMKKDALELSGQLAVKESFALRVVVLEWQSRAEAQLLSGGGDASRVAELGASVLGKSLTGLNGSVNGMVRPPIDFTDDGTRRRRQLDIFLEERSSRLRLAADLLGYEATHEKPAESKTWMDDLARQLFKDRFKLDTDTSVADQVFDKCMTALDEQLQVLDDPSKLPKLAQESDETMLMYAAATFNDIVATLRLMLVVLHVRKDVATSNMATSWYQKMETVNYFATLAPSPAWPDTTELQCLVSLISLAILDAPATIQQLQELDSQSTGVSYPRLNANRYFHNESCVRELNLILYRASVNDITILSPAIFAWGAITRLVQDVAGRYLASRDRMIEEGSSDNETLGRRRSSRRDSREETSLFEKLYASLQSVEMEPEAKENPPDWFALYATGVAFDVIAQLSISLSAASTCGFQLSTGILARIELLQLLRSGLSITVYGGEMLEALLAVLTPDAPGNTSGLNDINSRLCSRFIEDDIFRREILDQALTRYPFELSPVLRLLASLASAHETVRDIIELLDRLQTMTIMAPEHFNAYTLENEEENANEIRIERDLPLFVSRQSLSWYGSNMYKRKELTMGDGDDSDRGTNVMCVPAGTLATVLKESRPMVFKLEHAHSGLEYLGLLLSTRLPNAEMCVAREQPQLELGTAADIIGLINALLTATLKGRQGEQDAKFVLERMSEALPVETDIVNVVTELFESELLAHLEQTAQEGSLDVLVACAELFALLVKIEPGRIWIALAHSSLLGLNGGTNALAAVVGAMETALGQFRFLSACTTIFGNLIGDVVGGLIKRRPTTVQPARRGRFDSPMEKSEYTPERTMQRVLNAFTGVMLEAWESLGQWRFAVPAEKSSIAANICGGFALILRATYGLEAESTTQDSKEDVSKQERRLASMLFPAADAVLDFFAPRSENKTSMRSFSASFASAVAILSGTAATTDRSPQIEQVGSMVELLTTLLRTSREEDKEGKRAYGMATQLLNIMPDLAVIFTVEPSLKRTVATLLAEITTSLHGASDLHDPPSLLGQLSTSSAKAFLSVLSQIDRPLCDSSTERQIWNLLCSIMTGKQQWLALYLLTGSVPKERLDRSSTRTNGNGKSLLSYALAHLSRVEDLAHEPSCALLEFVSAAQGASIWANNEVRNHTNFLTSVIDWLDCLQISGKGGNTREQTLRATETRKASLVCEILAQAVHASVEVGDKGVLKMLRGKLNFLSAHGQTVDAYNRSLQLNLTDNFRSRFAGVEVGAFRRSAANPAEGYGKEWAYDLDIMDRALAHDNAWLGSMNQGGRSNGFRDEASRANVNFSLLSTQTELMKAWSALATTLAESLSSADEGVQVDISKSLAKAVRNCLEANATANIDVPGTDKVLMSRAEMSFVVLSKLASGTSTAEVKTVLPAAHRALQVSPADFDVATQEEDLQYYRLGLQVLFLAVQPHIHAAARGTATSNGGNKATEETPISYLDPAVAGVLRDIVTKVVAPAWRALAGNLHTNIACALPGDFALTTALLQAVLAVPGVGAVHSQIAEIVASTQLVRSALSLYSWADQLAEAMDGDPVYGELAVQFLQVLSTVRPVAEHIALEGALAQLASANLSSYFLKPGGKGPFDEPRRMFGIWAEDMLPLCLNLLDAVGPPIAGEISVFLNGFPLQLERANTALENRDATKFHPHAGAITLGLVQEAHSLCLISMILQSDTARAAAEGIDAAGSLRGYDYKKVVEDGAGLVRQKASLASRIMPANAAEFAWAGRMLDGVDSLLSAKIIKEVKGLAGLRGEEEDGSAA